jgi:hypothetical protein
MARQPRTARPLGAALAALLLASAAQAAEIGVVKSVSGHAMVTRAGADAPLALGDALFTGDEVATGADGALGVSLADGTSIALGADSRAELASFAVEPGAGLYDLLVRALAGRMILRSGLIGQEDPERVRVETPRVVVGVKGTRFAVVVREAE